MVGNPSWPNKKDLDALVSRANGLFIYASTALKFIQDINADDPCGQLEILLQTKADGFCSLYSDLDTIYAQILSGALPAQATRNRQENFKTIVGAIVLLLNPLSSLVLAKFLGVSAELITTTLMRLHSIIVVPHTADSPIHTLHASFADYLTSLDRCTNPLYFVDAPHHHGKLAILCLSHMSLLLNRDICNINDPSKLNSEVVHLQDLVSTFIPLHLQYSCKHWADHLSHAPNNLDTYKKLKAFCFQHILHWLEVLSLLGQLHIAALSLKHVKTWCLVSKIHDIEILNANIQYRQNKIRLWMTLLLIS